MNDGRIPMSRFEFDGEKYRKASTHQKEWGVDLIADIELRGDERVLDLGCGDGVLTEKLAALVPGGEAVGIDASASMVETANEIQRENLRFALMDIDDLDYEGEFDLIFSNATLHWVKDHVRLLANCHRALKPGGMIRLNFGADGNCSHLNRVLREVMAYPRFREHFASFEWPWYMPSLNEYQALLARTEFADVEVWGENRDRHFPDTEAMIKWIDQPSIVPFLEHVGEKDRCAFRRNVVSEMVDLTMQVDGTCFETFRRINVFARKNTECER